MKKQINKKIPTKLPYKKYSHREWTQRFAEIVVQSLNEKVLKEDRKDSTDYKKMLPDSKE